MVGLEVFDYLLDGYPRIQHVPELSRVRKPVIFHVASKLSS
jgi:hypothetical protein